MASPPELIGRCTFPPPGTEVTCAVSGGADSLALLVLATVAGCSVTAVHVDHGLRPGGAAEGDLVAAAARRYGARFRAARVEVTPGPNLEARARDARYGVLPADVCTGHTADDQAETILLALLRGAGWEGMSGMAPGPRRPLLALRRRETEALCRDEGLVPFADPSNRDPRHRRNRVRHELLPLLADIAERDVVDVLTRQVALFRDSGAVLDELALALDTSDARQLAAAPLALARLAVRQRIMALQPDLAPPDLACVDRVLAVARGDAVGADLRRGLRVRRSAQRLYFAPSEGCGSGSD